MEDILKSLDILLSDLSPQQIDGLKRLSQTISNPNNLTASQATRIVDELGIDIEALQKKAKALRAKNKPKKIGENEKCPCDSGKKYKKCCKNK